MSNGVFEADGKKWVTVWTEDECLRHDPTAERVDGAWKRLFGEDYPGREERDMVEDWGDSFAYRVGDRLLVSSYDGHSIAILSEESKPDVKAEAKEPKSLYCPGGGKLAVDDPAANGLPTCPTCRGMVHAFERVLPQHHYAPPPWLLWLKCQELEKRLKKLEDKEGR